MRRKLPLHGMPGFARFNIFHIRKILPCLDSRQYFYKRSNSNQATNYQAVRIDFARSDFIGTILFFRHVMLESDKGATSNAISIIHLFAFFHASALSNLEPCIVSKP